MIDVRVHIESGPSDRVDLSYPVLGYASDERGHICAILVNLDNHLFEAQVYELILCRQDACKVDGCTYLAAKERSKRVLGART